MRERRKDRAGKKGWRGGGRSGWVEYERGRNGIGLRSISAPGQKCLESGQLEGVHTLGILGKLPYTGIEHKTSDCETRKPPSCP